MSLHDELAAIVTAHVPDSMTMEDRRDLLAALTAWIDAQAAFALADNSLLYIEDCARKLAEQREAIERAKVPARGGVVNDLQAQVAALRPGDKVRVEVLESAPVLDVEASWCKCEDCWGWFVESHPGESLDELGKTRSWWWAGLPEHRDAPPVISVPCGAQHPTNPLVVPCVLCTRTRTASSRCWDRRRSSAKTPWSSHTRALTTTRLWIHPTPTGPFEEEL